MKKQGDQVYLQHILDSIAKIERYLHEVDENEFRSSDLLQDGVIRQIQIIGEASKRVSSDLCSISTHPLAGYGRNAQQTHSRLLWSRYRYGVDHCHLRSAGT